MSGNLTLKDYLDSSTESSNRVRNTVVILIFVTVLVLASNLNSAEWAWSFNRVDARVLENKTLDEKVRKLECSLATSEWREKNDCYLLASDPLFSHTYTSQNQVSAKADVSDIFTCGSEACYSTNWTVCLLPDGSYDQGCQNKEKLECYMCAKKESDEMLWQLRRSLIDNSYSVKAPFFGVSFDINDLGLIGGLSLIIVLTMLRLSLRNYIVGLRIGFKAAIKAEQRAEFYDILASRQLFVFPHLVDSKQDLYKGKTEEAWERSGLRKFYNVLGAIAETAFALLAKVLKSIYYQIILFSVKKPSEVSTTEQPGNNVSAKEQSENNKKENGWHANPQVWLKGVSRFISLIPMLVYFLVVYNDYNSLTLGTAINSRRANVGFVFSVFFLLVIIGLSCWCVSKWYEIDWLWEDFRKSEK